MALVWGHRPSDPSNLAWLNDEARQIGSRAPSASTWRCYGGLPVGEPGPPICPYQLHLPARTLTAQRLRSADHHRSIGGKHLVYSTHLQSTPDEIKSPYHGRIAGAFCTPWRSMSCLHSSASRNWPASSATAVTPP